MRRKIKIVDPLSPTSESVRVVTDPPASESSPMIDLGGTIYGATDKAPDGRQAAEHLREALYSGRIPAGAWAAAERVIARLLAGRTGAAGGATTGKSKRRGGPAYYAWVVSCRYAKKNGMPKPPKPKSAR